MIIDLNQVKLNYSLGDDTLWVVEQIPGLVVGADETQILRTGEVIYVIWLFLCV